MQQTDLTPYSFAAISKFRVGSVGPSRIAPHILSTGLTSGRFQSETSAPYNYKRDSETKTNYKFYKLKYTLPLLVNSSCLYVTADCISISMLLLLYAVITIYSTLVSTRFAHELDALIRNVHIITSPQYTDRTSLVSVIPITCSPCSAI